MYNADFFLYASLHHAADGHPGRVNPQNSPPVLTGMPVSSMILLDRPEEAGYFIFSDLSVRHEGQYFLKFALMEEVKEDRDKDPDEVMSGTDEITGPEMTSERHFCFRTTVTTDVFDVFSAKKFPGLQESTALSRTVAEQGCRVRIRRDVRMRRREKGGKGKDAAAAAAAATAREEEYAQKARAEASQHARDRSSSNENNGQYHTELQRRQSAMDFPPSRPSFSGSEISVGRPHPYGHLPSYGPHGQSMPPSPSYPPPPPHGAHYAPRPSYSNYSDQSPTQAYPPGPPPPREGYSYRPSVPLLAPKLEADEPTKPNILPPISQLDASAAQPRRPSYQPQLGSMPRLLPQPPHKRDISPPGAFHKIMDHSSPLPPLTGSYSRPSPPMPLTPSSTISSSSRKRTADEAFASTGPALPSEYYRMQNGRREDEQPRDANYKVEPSYRVSYGRDEPYIMSTPSYDRACDNPISVNFPNLHA